MEPRPFGAALLTRAMELTKTQTSYLSTYARAVTYSGLDFIAATVPYSEISARMERHSKAFSTNSSELIKIFRLLLVEELKRKAAKS